MKSDMEKRNRKLDVFCDTSVLISASIPDDSKHREAVKFFSKIKSNGLRICINNIVILEFVKYLKKKTNLSNNQIKEIMNEFISNKNVYIFNISDFKIVDFLLNILDSVQENLRSSDTLIAITAMHFDMLFITFDERVYKHISKIYNNTFKSFDDFEKQI